MKRFLTRDAVGKPNEPDFGYKHDRWYSVNIGFRSDINYSSLKTISPEVSRKLWNNCDIKLLHDLRYFAHNVQRGWEVKYGLLNESEYNSPEPALDINVEYFGFWATADDRLRYICENIVTNDKIGLIDKIGNGLASHFYGAREVHQAMTGKTDPKEALIDYTRLAKEQNDFKRTGKIGEYTKYLRVFLEKQKKKGVRFWGTTELHTSIQTAARRFVNGFYNGDPLHADKGTTNNVNEWLASYKNNGLMHKMISNSGMKSMCDILGSQWGVGDYYKFHGGSDLSLCPELNAYLDERYVVPGPGAKKVVTNLFPTISKKEVPLPDRIIWIRENQKALLGLPTLNSYFYKLKVKGTNVFPEIINEIKSTQAEVLCCQFGVYHEIKGDPKRIAKRSVARNIKKCNII